MPITWDFEPEGRFILFSVKDPYTLDEWRDAMTAILTAPVRTIHLALLVDRRHAQPLTTGAVARMTRFMAEHQRALARGRVAILVNDQTAFGMARMIELRTRLDIPSTHIRAFRHYEEAIEWLVQ